jgi:prevent-host-death family protein
MKTVNIHEAKTHLSRLIEEAVHGEGFIIAKAGRPMVQVTAIEEPERPDRALGWMRGQFTIPDDFITMNADEIQAMFEGQTMFEVQE